MSGQVTRRLSRDGAVQVVTVDRPAKLNVLDPAMIAALTAAFAEPAPGARALVLTGQGPRAFIGGADIAAMAALDGPAAARAFITSLHRLCAAIRNAPVPVVASIRGYCFGAGLEVAAACDLRVADPTAVFGMPEVNVGLPSVIEAALLPTLIGAGRTRDLVMTGRRLSAAEALDWGFVTRLAPEGGLDAATDAVLSELLAAGAESLRLQKRLCNEWEQVGTDMAVAAGIRTFGEAFEGPEPTRMLRAFLDRKR